MTTKQVWLGYRKTGGRLEVSDQELNGGLAVLGQGSRDLAALLAYACNESGLRTLLVDMRGRLTEALSGYVASYLPSHFLYDSFKVEESPSVHGQLAASAYACSLDLSFEQEGLVATATQTLAREGGVLSPAGIGDLMTKQHDDFRGRPVDRIKARLNSIGSLNISGDPGTLQAVLEGSAVLDFSGLGQPEAVETAAALFLAKLLALEDDGAKVPDVVILEDANRLFRPRPVFRRSERLLTALVGSSISRVLSSESTYGLDEHFEETCAAKMLSSAVWNRDGRREQTLLPNMFMFRRHPYGADVPFVPREFEPRKGRLEGSKVEAAADTPPEPAEKDFVTLILETIESYDGGTRESLLSFLSQRFEKERAERTLDELQRSGAVAVETRRVKAGPPLAALTLTEKGKDLLEMGR